MKNIAVTPGAINKLNEQVSDATKIKVFKYEVSAYNVGANEQVKLIGSLSTLTNGVVTKDNCVGALLTYNGLAACALLDSTRDNLYLYVIATSTVAVAKKMTVLIYYE